MPSPHDENQKMLNLPGIDAHSNPEAAAGGARPSARLTSAKESFEQILAILQTMSLKAEELAILRALFMHSYSQGVLDGIEACSSAVDRAFEKNRPANPGGAQKQ